MDFKAKVSKYGNDRLHIEIPKLQRKEYKKGTIVRVEKEQ
jgi:hypothetical protein